MGVSTVAPSLLAVLALGAGAAGGGGATGVVEPTVIMISLDGFRWDYQELAETPTLDRIYATGVRAEALVPVFPAETFPGHYALATGLHPEHNGIVSNTMWDPEFEAIYGVARDRDETFESRWWEGEPIWVTAHEQGLITASYFWVGTEAVIHGVQPDHWFRYDGSVAPEARVDQILAWLDLPTDERPRLLSFYLDEPNSSGHRFGATAPETLAMVERVDAVLGRLVEGLEVRGLFEQIDIVIVSDHGMTDVAPERTLRLEDYVDLEDVRFVNGGTSLQLVPEPGREEAVYRALLGAHPKLHVYRRGRVPERFHFNDHRRIPPIVGVLENGWLVDTAEGLESVWSGELEGAHGFDNQHSDMWGIFYAHGPSFRRGVRAPRLSAVDVYQVVAAALEIEPAPNDGDPAVLDVVLGDS